MLGLKVGDPSEGAGGGTGGSPFAELPVLAGPHKVLAPPVVGMLVEGPVAVHDVGGVDVTATEAVLDGVTVLAELHHLSLEVWPLVDSHTVGTAAGIRKGTAGANGVAVSHPALVLWVLSPGQYILVASVVGPLVQHPAAAIYLDGVAAAEMGVHIGAVRVALIGATLEVFILVESDLWIIFLGSTMTLLC